MSSKSASVPVIGRVLVWADESANWKVAGLRQLDRIALTFQEFTRSVGESLTLHVSWDARVPLERRWLPNDPRLESLAIVDSAAPADRVDLVLNTRVFLYRNSIAELLTTLPEPTAFDPAQFERERSPRRWSYLHGEREVGACEREFLRKTGKSQDGLVSRYLNRPISRACTRVLLKLPIKPTAWSIAIFVLPLWASLFFLRGTDTAFLLGCLIFQLYSILDGCDGEIARAKFLQSESGRRLDSLLDLVGNMLLALALGIGLARQYERAHASGWFYIAEGFAAALCIITSEGIVFARRTRSDATTASAKWNGALYQRHHEFLERSGLLALGDKFAWWVVQLTKRDMGMLAFVLLAAIGHAEGILHLLLLVSALSSALAGNAFLRQPAPALPQEAS